MLRGMTGLADATAPDRRRAQGRPHPRAAPAAGRSRRVRRGQRRVPGDRLGLDRLRGRQRHPDRALLPVRVGHAARGLLRPRERQPRPQVVRAPLRLDPLRHQRRGRPRQPAGRAPPPARRRRRRHRPRGARRRPLHRPGPQGRRDRRPRARGRHRRARHHPDRRHRDVRRDPAHAGRPQPVRRPVPARLRRRAEHLGQARGPAEAALPGARPHRRQRRARPDGRVGHLLQQGDGLREHGGVHRRRHRHRLLGADVARSSRTATTG